MTTTIVYLLSLPIIKRFWPNILSAKKGSKNSCFGGFGGEIFDPEVEAPRKYRNTSFGAKTVAILPKMIYRAAQEITKK